MTSIVMISSGAGAAVRALSWVTASFRRGAVSLSSEEASFRREAALLWLETASFRRVWWSERGSSS
jgi:hypothetical protein